MHLNFIIMEKILLVSWMNRNKWEIAIKSIKSQVVRWSFSCNLYHTPKTKEVWYKLQIDSSIKIDSAVLQLFFLDLLYKEKLINKETYYAARVTLHGTHSKILLHKY